MAAFCLSSVFIKMLPLRLPDTPVAGAVNQSEPLSSDAPGPQAQTQTHTHPNTFVSLLKSLLFIYSFSSAAAVMLIITEGINKVSQ